MIFAPARWHRVEELSVIRLPVLCLHDGCALYQSSVAVIYDNKQVYICERGADVTAYILTDIFERTDKDDCGSCETTFA